MKAVGFCRNRAHRYSRFLSNSSSRVNNDIDKPHYFDNSLVRSIVHPFVLRQLKKSSLESNLGYIAHERLSLMSKLTNCSSEHIVSLESKQWNNRINVREALRKAFSSSSNDLKDNICFLSVLFNQDVSIWKEIDDFIMENLPFMTIDTLLLTSYWLRQAAAERLNSVKLKSVEKISTSLITNRKLFNMIKVKNESENALSESLEMLSIIGMQISSCSTFKNGTPLHQLFIKNYQDILKHTITQSTTAEHCTLRYYFDYCPHFPVAFSFEFYRELYALSYRSVHKYEDDAIQPLNLFALVKCMTHTKIRNVSLIDRICQVIERTKKYPGYLGAILFHEFIELGMSPYAIDVAEQLMMDINGCDFSGRLIGDRKLLQYSESAKRRIEENLSSVEKWTVAHAKLALSAFSMEYSNTSRRQLLMKILDNVQLHSYASAIDLMTFLSFTRFKHIDLIERIEKFVTKPFNSLAERKKVQFLNAFATINHRPLSFANIIDQIFPFQELSNSHKIMFFWSLAALNLNHVDKIPEYLRSLRFYDTMSYIPKDEAVSLYQVLLDWRGCLRSKAMQLETQDDQFLSSLWEKSIKSLDLYQSRYKPMISFHQRSIENFLRHLDCPFTMECSVEGGYFVDFLISSSSILSLAAVKSRIQLQSPSNTATLLQDMKPFVDPQSVWSFSTDIVKDENPRRIRGIALEYDGPYHFDQVSRNPIGKYVLKRRLLESMGYLVISIPFWRANIRDNSEFQSFLMDCLVTSYFYQKHCSSFKPILPWNEIAKKRVGTSEER